MAAGLDPGGDAGAVGEGAGEDGPEGKWRLDHRYTRLIAAGPLCEAGPPFRQMGPDVDSNYFLGAHGAGGPEGAGIAEAAVERDNPADAFGGEEERDGARGEEDIGIDIAIPNQHLPALPTLADDDGEIDTGPPVADKGADHGFEVAGVEDAAAGGGGIEP